MKDLTFWGIVLACLLFSIQSVFGQGHAVEFLGDGKTRVCAPGNPSLDITDELTMEAWVYPTATSDSAIIVNKESSWECALRSNRLHAAINAGEWAWHGGGETPLNEWSHVAVSFDGNEHHTFVNGKYQASRKNAGQIKTSNDPFCVGWRTGTASHEPFTGIIDEVRISNVVRYQKGRDFPVPVAEFTPDNNTVVLYHFNEGKGAKTKDESKNKNDAELSDGAKFVVSKAPIKAAAASAFGKIAMIWGKIKIVY